MHNNKSQPRLLDVNRVPGQPKRRKKITLVFDEQKRREFLGGFRKRKLERKKKAEEQLQRQLKEERKKIKQDARERYKKLLSHRNVPELEELLSRQEYDLEGHTVSILELNVADLAEGSRWIGPNRNAEEKEGEREEDERDSSSDDDNSEEIVGMSLREKRKNPAQRENKSASQEIKSSKEVKREIKQAALKQVKRSKAFQRKQEIERQKNKKQSRQRLHRVQKLAHKRGKRLKRKPEH